MEFVDGQPLSRMRRFPGLPLALHLCIIADVLSGLHHAHELRDFGGTPLQVVHRDISPQNVLVSYDGMAKLVDFGIAKAETQLAHTLAGCVKGKIAYMSPEQVLGEPLDRRSDLFAVGVLLWEACARQRLFPGISARERVRRLQAAAIPSLTQIDPQLPPALDQLCRRALAFSPERRFQTAAEIEVELQALLAGPDLPATRRDVAAFMAQHYQSERSRTLLLIESKLGHLSLENQSQRAPDMSDGKPLPPPHGLDVSLRATLLLDSATVQSAMSPLRPSSVPPPSVAPPSYVGAVPRPSVHSWGRSAPPPPPAPSATSEHASRTVFLQAAMAGLFLVGIGAAAFAVGRALEPKRQVSAASVGASSSSVPPRTATPASSAATLPGPAPRVRELARSEPAASASAPSLLQVKKTAVKKAPLSPPKLAASQEPPAQSILVTDFGGRR